MNVFVLPFPNIDPVLIEFGPLAIRWYGLAYVAGLILGWWYAVRLIGDRRLWGPGGPPAQRADMNDLIVWITFGVILGGRLGYMLFYKPAYYLSNPLEILQLWHGGMSFHGGMLGVVIALVLFCWKNRLPLLSISDAVAAVTPIGLFFGRIANFINGELYGRATDVPWAMVFPMDPEQRPRHPSQLYEATLEGLVLFIILRLFTHRFDSLKQPGVTLGVFLIGYGLARSFVEMFRMPDPQLGFIFGELTMGMLLSLPMILIGIVFVVAALMQRHARA